MSTDVNVWSKGDSDAGNERQNNIKDPVVTTAQVPITLAGLQLISTVQLVQGDRILVTAQGTPADNGIYIASATTWTRATDFNDNDDFVSGTMVLDSSSAIMNFVTFSGSLSIGVTALVFSPISYAAGIITEVHTAAAGQTVFTLANTYSKLFNNLTVHIEGVWQEPTQAYTKTGANDITFAPTPALLLGNRVVFTLNEVLENVASPAKDATDVTFTEIGQPTETVDSALNALIVQVDSINVSPNADTVDGLHASQSPIADTLLALNSQSKLPASITGDAGTLNALTAAQILAAAALAASSVPTYQVFTVAGAAIYTKPAGLVRAIFLIVGGAGGGGGGGADSQGAGTALGGNGGAGGQAVTVVVELLASALSATQALTIGAGGAGGAPSFNGAAGSSSSLDSIQTSGGSGGGIAGSPGDTVTPGINGAAGATGIITPAQVVASAPKVYGVDQRGLGGAGGTGQGNPGAITAGSAGATGSIVVVEFY